jgi:hypothetical protein
MRTIARRVRLDWFCSEVYHLENCFSSLFIALGSEVVWWACEDIRVGFSYTFCPDSGNLVCKLLRKKSHEQPQINESDKYKVDIGRKLQSKPTHYAQKNHTMLSVTQLVFDYPPKPNGEIV